MTERRLIGYQVKRLDQLIEATFDQAAAEVGMTRREWQVLTTLGRGPATADALQDALRPFWETTTDSVAALTTELTTRGWLTRDADARFALTEAGISAHAAATHSVGTLRARMTTGVAAADFDTCTTVLARMIANLEPAS
ncbi:winged helix DNA-binding protein [Nocardia sp. AG03]|uniref:MarR family winged helix-turn-helix transcriptional regulator n=1 Tax=Nocardia sp. AG03 TaxID=3025312 RepID=UPI0024189B6A|nr:winged helix DNA-binding protein [Nocardia sp. AG03]